MPKKQKEKPVPDETTASSSSSVQTTLNFPALQPQGTDRGVMDIQQVTEMFQKLQIGQDAMRKDVRQEVADLREEIKKDFDVLRADLTNVKQTADDNKKRVEGLEGEMKGMQRGKSDMESTILKYELDRTSYYLRFQNIEEEEGENLKSVMCTILSEFIGRERERMYWDIDQAYRVNSNYAKTHNVPREIHVKFLKLETRDEILRARRAGVLKYRDKEINILKQIPRKVRNIRQRYFFLSNKLYLKGIMFRWLMPEGLLVFWEGGRIRINSVGEAEAFLKKHKNLLEGEEEVQGAVGGAEEAGTSSGAGGEQYSGI